MPTGFRRASHAPQRPLASCARATLRCAHEPHARIAARSIRSTGPRAPHQENVPSAQESTQPSALHISFTHNISACGRSPHAPQRPHASCARATLCCAHEARARSTARSIRSTRPRAPHQENGPSAQESTRPSALHISFTHNISACGRSPT